MKTKSFSDLLLAFLSTKKFEILNIIILLCHCLLYSFMLYYRSDCTIQARGKMATPPLPPKRTKILTTLDNEWKRSLTGSFEGFNSSQVSRDHIKKAEECIDNGGTRDERYRLVPFERILNENKVKIKFSYTCTTHVHICTSAYIICTFCRYTYQYP